MDKKIIELAKYLKTSPVSPAPTDESCVQAGISALDQLSPTDRKAATEFILRYAFMEIRTGLGLVDIPEGHEDPDIESLTIFNAVADIYEEAAGGCYFCSGMTDPNEDGFNEDTELCLMCKLKLANFTEALGIPAGKVFTGMRSRRNIQKTRIKLNGTDNDTDNTDGTEKTNQNYPQ